jgi:hypothetical protein
MINLQVSNPQVSLQRVSLILKARLHQKVTLGLQGQTLKQDRGQTLTQDRGQTLKQDRMQEDIRTYFSCK